MIKKSTILAARPCVQSSWNLKHVFPITTRSQVSRRLIKQFQRKHYLIFFFNPLWLLNKPCDVSIIFLTNLYTQGLGNICVKFLLDLSSHSGEEDFFFIGFRVNSIWLPNHMTDDVICVNILFRMDASCRMTNIKMTVYSQN